MPRVEKKKHRRSFGRRRKAWDPITNSIVPRIPDDVRVRAVAPRPRPGVGRRRRDDAVDSHDEDRAAGTGGRRRTDDDNDDDDDCRSASGPETGLDPPPPPPAAPAIMAASIGNGGDDGGIIAASASVLGRRKKKEGGIEGGGGRAGCRGHRPKDGRRVVLGDRSNVLPANDAPARTGDSKREFLRIIIPCVVAVDDRYIFQKAKSPCAEMLIPLYIHIRKTNAMIRQRDRPPPSGRIVPRASRGPPPARPRPSTTTAGPGPGRRVGRRGGAKEATTASAESAAMAAAATTRTINDAGRRPSNSS